MWLSCWSFVHDLFYGVSIKPDTFFSHVHAFQTCLFLLRCLFLQEHATDAGPQVQEECSRGGRKEHGSHLDTGRAKAAGRTTRAFAQALHLPSRQRYRSFLSPRTPMCPSRSTEEG